MEVIQRKSWFKRNWMWFVPSMGCLTIIILFFLGIGAILFGLTDFDVKDMMSSSKHREYALEKANENKDAIYILGDSIQSTGTMRSSFTINGSTTEASLTFAVKGSKKRGSIEIFAHKKDLKWYYDTIYLFVKEENVKINLLDQKLDDF